VVEELFCEFEVASPKIEKAFPDAFNGVVIGITILESSAIPLPIP